MGATGKEWYSTVHEDTVDWQVPSETEFHKYLSSVWKQNSDNLSQYVEDYLQARDDLDKVCAKLYPEIGRSLDDYYANMDEKSIPNKSYAKGLAQARKDMDKLLDSNENRY